MHSKKRTHARTTHRRRLLILGCVALLVSHDATAAVKRRMPSANPQTLIDRCLKIAATAHPWRAKQIQRSILHYRLALSYRATSTETFTLRELASMRASEIEAAETLELTCQTRSPQNEASLSPAGTRP